MKPIALFVDNESRKETLDFYKILEQVDFPEGLAIAINNLPDAESGILREEGKVTELSLAHCFSLEDVIREMAQLIMDPKFQEASEIEEY